METRQAQTNTFTEGLNTDFHPLNISNTLLTDCINGTIITNDGHEPILQNDQGNKEINCKLYPNYIPVGIKEWNNILYIVSYNPETKDTMYGSYPSVTKKKSTNIVGSSTFENLFDFYEKLNPEENEVNYTSAEKIISSTFSIEENEDADTITITPSDIGSFTYVLIKNINESYYMYSDGALNIPNNTYNVTLNCITPDTIGTEITGTKMKQSSGKYNYSLNLKSNLTLKDTLSEEALSKLELKVTWGSSEDETKIINYSKSPLEFEASFSIDDKDISEITVVPRLPFTYEGNIYYILYDQLLEKVALNKVEEVIYFGNNIFKYYFKYNNPNSYEVVVNIDFQRPTDWIANYSTLRSTFTPIILNEDNKISDSEQSWKVKYNSNGLSDGIMKFTYEHEDASYTYYWLKVTIQLEHQRYSENTYPVEGNFIVVNDKYFYNNYLNINNYRNIYLTDWVNPAIWDESKLSLRINKLESTFSEKSINTSNLKSLGSYIPRLSYNNFPTDEEIIQDLPNVEVVTKYSVSLIGDDKVLTELNTDVGYKVTYYIGEDYSNTIDLPKLTDTSTSIQDTYVIDNISSKNYLCIDNVVQEYSNIGTHLYDVDLFEVVTDNDISYISVKFRTSEQTLFDRGVIKINGDFELEQDVANKICLFLNSHIYRNKWTTNLYKYVIKVPENIENNIICNIDTSTVVSTVECSISPEKVYFPNKEGKYIESSDIVINPYIYGFETFNNISVIIPRDVVSYSVSKDVDFVLNAESISADKKVMLENYLEDYFLKLPTIENLEVSTDLGSALIQIKTNSSNNREFESYVDKYPSNYNLDILKDVKIEEEGSTINSILVIDNSKILDSDSESKWKNKLDVNVDIDVDDNFNNIYYSGEYLNY